MQSLMKNNNNHIATLLQWESCDKVRKMPTAGFIEPPLPGSMREVIHCELIRAAEKKILEIFRLDCFQSSQQLPPLKSFIHDILKKTSLCSLTLIVALMYMERLCQINPNYKTTRFLAYSGTMTALIVASKFLFDDTYDNKAWSTASKLFSLTQINKMESELLFRLRYHLSFTSEELCDFIAKLELYLVVPYSICNLVSDSVDKALFFQVRTAAG